MILRRRRGASATYKQAEVSIMDKWTKTRVGRPALIALTVAAIVAALPLEAADQQSAEPKKASKQENVGVLTGLVVGAVAGGPVGAVLGAGAGAWLGDRYHKQLVAKQELAADLSRSEADRAQLDQNVVDLNGSVRNLEAQRVQLSGALEHTRDLGAEVDFRTNDVSLSSDSVARLTRLGAVAGALPDLKIRVCGYADPRGAPGYNLALSQRRAEAVAAVLQEAGVGAERLIVEAHGTEGSTSAEGDLDGYALERRVTVQLEDTGDGKLAQAQ
jgi:outer membrane protein OmpA-like peptidoglycan-associated protein